MPSSTANDRARLPAHVRLLAQRLAGAASVKAACEVVADHLAQDGRLLPSIYLEQAGRLRCQAQRGYWQVFDGMPPSSGVIGRTFTTGEPAVVLDVETTPQYLEAVPGVRGEICVPVRADGRVAGVINVESRELLEPAALELAKVCARLLGERLATLGGPAAASPSQRLARHAAQLAGLVDDLEIGQAAVAAACDVSDMDSAMIATVDASANLLPGHVAGPLGEVLLGVDKPALGRMFSWVRAGTSCYTVGTAGGVGFLGADFLRASGAETLVVLPLPGKPDQVGMLVVADRAAVVIDTEVVELLELLAAQAASSLQTAAALAELRDRAARDPLTGLGHHASFHAALKATRVQAAGGATAVLMIDVDGFKAINDTSGHAHGDRVLRAIAGVLRAELREGDELFRIGGDEFAALATVSGETQALDLGERLCAAVRAVGRTTLSIGVAVAAYEEPDALLGRADQALYTVKRRGRDGVELAPAPHGAPERAGDANPLAA